MKLKWENRYGKLTYFSLGFAYGGFQARIDMLTNELARTWHLVIQKDCMWAGWNCKEGETDFFYRWKKIESY